MQQTGLVLKSGSIAFILWQSRKPGDVFICLFFFN